MNAGKLTIANVNAGLIVSPTKTPNLVILSMILKREEEKKSPRSIVETKAKKKIPKESLTKIQGTNMISTSEKR